MDAFSSVQKLYKMWSTYYAIRNPFFNPNLTQKVAVIKSNFKAKIKIYGYIV